MLYKRSYEVFFLWIASTWYFTEILFYGSSLSTSQLSYRVLKILLFWYILSFSMFPSSTVLTRMVNRFILVAWFMGFHFSLLVWYNKSRHCTINLFQWLVAIIGFQVFHICVQMFISMELHCLLFSSFLILFIHLDLRCFWCFQIPTFKFLVLATAFLSSSSCLLTM